MIEIGETLTPGLKTLTKPTPVVMSKSLLNVIEEQQVIVHCRYDPWMFEDRIRIWKSTFLYPKGLSKRSKLIQAYNISFFPDWTIVDAGSPISFTLIFSGLPKQCEAFDLIEQIPESGGFIVKNIERNASDIYHLEIT